jgi:hypothetical protein
MKERKTKVLELLRALDRLIPELSTQIAEARSGIGHHSLDAYRIYRAKLDEYHSLVAVVENQLHDMAPGRQQRVRARLQEREREALAMIIHAALDFFFALSAIPNLPIGIRECFEQELQSLHRAEARLSAPEHEGKLSPALAGDLETAGLLLAEIMAKAPAMLNFGAPV